MRTLLVVGIGVFVAGLVTAAFGLPVKEFSFGNTLILSGTVMSCTGLIMISLSLVVREVRGAADRLRSAAMAADRGVPDLRGPILPGRSLRDDPPPWDADRGAPNAEHDPAAMPSVQSARLQADVPTRDRAVVVAAAAPEIAAPEPPASSDMLPPKSRRNLLFVSSMRRDRERAMAERSDPAGWSPPAAHARELDVSRVSFDDAGARSERSRAEADSASSPASPAGTRADRPGSLPSQNAAPITVLRSGVVDGMAYSLFSDGTIEAQMPEGMMRFASIDQLRAHLDNRPARSSLK
ncbi:MAG: hypothetical protein ACTHK9_06485 [Nitrobacter sp.]|jgi:hypothetical protein